MQEKLDSCLSDLENERLTVERLRRQETDRLLENNSTVEGFRSEISRLENELRLAE